MRTVCFCLLLSFCTPILAQDDPLFTTPEEARQDPDYLVQGEYSGPRRAMQVIALGEGEFEAVIYDGGLPGAGWNGVAPRRLELYAEEVAELAESNQMERAERRSPTLGLKPPAGAVVLFDGTPELLQQRWKEGARLTDDGLLMEGATSVDTFQSYTLHLEFRTPFRPQARGQGRGNSGVYQQGRYEIQILDSFGLEGKNNETGGIYSIRDPDLNMCLPPLTWQTYDVVFTAAQFDASGKKLTPAKMTVRLNGVLVQPDVELTGSTTAAPEKEGIAAGPIYLQDHGNPVRFRNIWLKPRDVEKEALRPIVPGFERFFTSSNDPSGLGGRILIGELGCTACHQSDSEAVSAKQAPILDHVGERIRFDYLLEFIQSPHSIKPGTTMPLMFNHLPVEERRQTAKAIASFLSTTGSVVYRTGNPKSARSGDKIFHSIGCTACHAPQDGTSVASATTVPLVNLEHKYTLDSLARFLRNPHQVRPSGRMPSLSLDGVQAHDVATFLLRDAVVSDALENMQVAFYQGNWEQLPDFGEIQPYEELTTYGLDLQATSKKKLDQFAARFESFFMAPEDSIYRFHLGSDDGSRLFIDGERIVDNDGVHGMQWRDGTVRLTRGPHAIRVDFFEKDGGEELHLEVEGGGLRKTPIESLVSLEPHSADSQPLLESKFAPERSLIETGRHLFSSAGCADCHQLHSGGDRLEGRPAAPKLKNLRETAGCMAETVPAGLPDYELTDAQREAIQLALVKLRDTTRSPSDTQTILATMITMNCYACHSRDSVGGPQRSRDGVFQTTMQEMGDEGRVPPPLDGVGDKLTEEYLRATLVEGANERPYMLVNMPGFGKGNLDRFAEAIVRSDLQTQARIDRAEGSEEQVKSSGRLLAGSKGLSCIKCHTAGGQGSGIRAMDMQRMTTRLREDWFHRYLMSPTTYRPGTRMPASFPDGKSVLPDLYEGNPSRQLDALWQYLSDGAEAKLPIGAQAQLIELIATDRPVIYRNFLEGLSPRGIAVGYPAGGNIAWDAHTMALRLLWKGALMDASKHWVGRGPGEQVPLGDQILTLEDSSPVAVLDSLEDPWPTGSARDRGYQFLGYRLDSAGQPTFRYRIGKVEVEDTPIPITDLERGVVFRRRLRLIGNTTGVVLRVASGEKVDASGEWFRVDDRYSVRVSGVQPVTTKTSRGTELRYPVDLSQGSAEVIQELQW